MSSELARLMRSTWNMKRIPPQKFPVDLVVHESILLGAPAVLAEQSTDGTEPPTGVMASLCTLRSDRNMMAVTIRLGRQRLIISAANALALSFALQEHVAHLGDKAQFLMVEERVEDVPEGKN